METAVQRRGKSARATSTGSLSLKAATAATLDSLRSLANEPHIAHGDVINSREGTSPQNPPLINHEGMGQIGQESWIKLEKKAVSVNKNMDPAGDSVVVMNEEAECAMLLCLQWYAEEDGLMCTRWWGLIAYVPGHCSLNKSMILRAKR